jgi:predicted RNA binding protein YcfA (HicA-like mRNA interferase family)
VFVWTEIETRTQRIFNPTIEELDFGESMTVREVLKMLEADGWQLVVIQGSHRQFKHPTKPGRVTVAGKPSDDLPLLEAITLHLAGMQEDGVPIPESSSVVDYLEMEACA